MELDPDDGAYRRLEAQGRLLITIARETTTNTMVGYAAFIHGPHLHYRKLHAGFDDVYFVDRRYRHGFVGFKLLRTALRGLKERGVQYVAMRPPRSVDPRGRNRGRIMLQRLGFQPGYQVYFLRLDHARF